MIKRTSAVLALVLVAACASNPMTSSTPGGGNTGLHLRGTMTNRGFIAATDVQGNGKFCADGQDWLSLSELKVYKSADGKTQPRRTSSAAPPTPASSPRRARS